MVARNDITGDAIQTKGTSTAYRDNYDIIFRKNKNSDNRLAEEEKTNLEEKENKNGDRNDT